MSDNVRSVNTFDGSWVGTTTGAASATAAMPATHMTGAARTRPIAPRRNGISTTRYET